MSDHGDPQGLLAARADCIYLACDADRFWVKPVFVRNHISAFLPSCVISRRAQLDTLLQTLSAFADADLVCFSRSFVRRSGADLLFFRTFYDHGAGKAPSHLVGYWITIARGSLVEHAQREIGKRRSFRRIVAQLPDDYDKMPDIAGIGRQTFRTVAGTISVIKAIGNATPATYGQEVVMERHAHV